jgi:hypothetical protein
MSTEYYPYRAVNEWYQGHKFTYPLAVLQEWVQRTTTWLELARQRQKTWNWLGDPLVLPCPCCYRRMMWKYELSSWQIVEERPLCTTCAERRGNLSLARYARSWPGATERLFL